MLFSISRPIKLFCVGLLTLATASCSAPAPTAYQKQVAIPAAAWDYAFQPQFTFDISDTAAQYRVFLIFRYDAGYEFSNIWVRPYMQKPGDSTFTAGKRLETALIAHDGSRLGNKMGGIYEYKIQLAPEDFEAFDRPGRYVVKLEQIMRKNPLVGLVNIGLRIERYDVK